MEFNIGKILTKKLCPKFEKFVGDLDKRSERGHRGPETKTTTAIGASVKWAFYE